MTNLARLGADLMARTLAALERGSIGEQPQPDEGVTYAKKIEKDGDPHRLDEIGARDRLPHPRPVADARCMVRSEGRAGEDPELRTGGRQRRAGDLARRRADHRLRRGRAAPDAIAASRQVCDGCRRIAARISRCRAARSSADMPRYRLTLEYDGGALVGWQRQDNGASVQGALEDAIEQTLRRARHGARRRPHRCRRARAGAGGAFRSCEGVRAGPDARRAQPLSAARCDRRAGGGDRRARFPCAVFGDGAALSVSHPRAPPAAGAGARPCLACGARARCRGDAPCGAGAGGPARFHDLPRCRVPGKIAGEDAGQARVRACGRRDSHRGLGALVPAPPGALNGGLAEAGGRRKMAAARSCRCADCQGPLPLRPRRAAGGLYLVRVDY